MSQALLVTKVQVPPTPGHFVYRARLTDALEHAIPGHKLILVSAPAGYGKTTLLAQWAHTSQFKIAWFQVSKEENDPERFFRYLFSAWNRIHSTIRESPLGLLLSGMAPEIDAVQTAFVNTASDLLEPLVLVLDDIHTIDDPAIFQSLTFLLDHLPPTIHFILAGRADPPLPLARYRARRELMELRAEDLQFLPDEADELMNRVMGFGLDTDEIVKLQAQVEGWITGLHLLALTIRHGHQASSQPVLWGKQRFIADYLRDDVLAHLPEQIRTFLLRTSILDELCGPLCEAVTSHDGGQAMLENLDRQNLFLIPLDEHREWFRYHRLFADFLRGELERVHPQELLPLHRRAAGWYLVHNLPEQAVQHAIAGEDAERMVEIAEQYFERRLLSGEYRTLKSWLDLIPGQWQVDYPILGLYQAAIFLFTGAVNVGAQHINEVEQRLRQANRQDSGWVLARITAVRCSIACFQNDIVQAEKYAGKAFQELPAEDHAFRAIIYHSLGDTYRRNGRWEEARQCYQYVLEMVQAPSYLIRSVHVYGSLADLDLQRGRLRGAMEHWRRALTIIEAPDTWSSFPLPLIGWVYIRMAEILFEWNALEEAQGYLVEGLALVQLGGDQRAVITGFMLACRLAIGRREFEAAATYFNQVRMLIEQSSFADMASQFERLQLVLWLSQENQRAVIQWVESKQHSPQLSDWLDPDAQYLTLIRGMIVRQDRVSLELALKNIVHLLPVAEAAGRLGMCIEALLLQAQIVWKLGDLSGSMMPLERALRLAEPEGYIRLIVDLGLPMARLLQEARSRGVMPDVIDKILAAFNLDPPYSKRETEALSEPLSAREHEILQQLAAGMTNREIAKKLVISPETVKKHTASIYSKLGVRSRTEAAATARRLDLLT